MPDPENDALHRARTGLRELEENLQSLMLATVDDRGRPGISCAPFIRHGDAFYVFVSRLSPHTAQLLRATQVAAMLVEDESATAQMYARRRVSYLCQVQVIERQDELFARVLVLLEGRFGPVVATLRSLPDFILFRLTPVAGRFVAGFGQAYDLGGADLVDLVRVGPEPAV